MNVAHGQSPLWKTKFSRIEVTSGLSNSNVTCILQDSKGFMWFGTEDGLNKYDGYDFTIYRNNPEDTLTSLRTNSIYCIFEDSDKKLWVSSRGGGVHYYDPEQDKFIRIPDFSSSCEINQIIEDDEKNIWLAGKRKEYAYIAYLSAKTKRWKSFDLFKTREAISCILSAGENKFWLGVRRQGFHKWNFSTNTLEETYYHNDSDDSTLADDDVRKITVDDTGDLWLATTNGLSEFNPNSHSFHNYTTATTKGLVVGTISDISKDGNYLWLATQNGGISKFNWKTKQVENNFLFDRNEPNSLSDNSVWAIYMDRQKRIWCGTFSKGICIIDKQQEKFYELDVPLENDIVNAVFKDEKNRIWIGTEGGVTQKDGDQITVFKHDPLIKNSLSSNPILSIHQDSKKRLWFGTWAGGLNRYDDKTNSFISYQPQKNNEQSISDANVYSVLEDRLSHQLWVSSYRGLNLLADEKRGIFEHFIDAPTHEANNYLKTLYQDKTGQLWTGSIAELNLFDLKTKTRKRFYLGSNGDSTTNGEIYCMHEDQKGRFWIGAVNGLHLKIPGNKFKSYSKKNGLPSNIVNGILEDSKGNLWLSTTNGISMFDPNRETFTNYDVSDGLISNEFKPNACYKSEDGLFFFGGDRVIVFNPDSIRKNKNIPPVFFTGLKVRNRIVEINGGDSILHAHINEVKHITIPYVNNFFTIQYVALNFTATRKNEYAYRLEGFDKDWVYVGNQRYATYTNLDEGTYTFRVKASNNDGVWNETGNVITVTIQPPWWNTYLFKGFAFLIFILAGLFYYRLRVGIVRRQNKKLEFLVTARTHELEKSYHDLRNREEQISKQNIKLIEHQEELAAQNEELIQSQEEISAQRDLVSDQNRKLAEAQRTIEEQSKKIITRNIDLEQEVEARTKELLAYNQQLEQFAFITAHNLRAPVARILGLGHVLNLSEGNPVEEKVIFEKLIFTTKELDRVVKDLNTILDVKNTSSLTLSDINLNEELKVVRIILEKEILDTSTEIKTDFTVVPSIRSVKPYLESIIINLVGNAIKYRREGRKPLIVLRTSLVDDYVCLEVSDNGLGLDLTLHKDKLFNLYSRFHTHVDGKGMGLYLVKTQIEALGGKIEVESEVDNGLTFRLYFKDKMD